MSSFNDFNNPQVTKLPKHLRQFIVEQHYEKYTPVDQAVWRYVMRQNYSYLKDVAYYPYIKGLQSAGLTIERIPDLQTMNDHLGKFGWGAVTVDGFIPPAAFMEYQAYHVLVIAADIRQINHIEYTPAPDIIHESAGHAPIIVEADYNNYLSYIGSIGTKAMFSAKDFELYEAIRSLSILKEAIDADEAELIKAEAHLQQVAENMGPPSEMALLSRLHWWTVEYGLIGTIENPKIYGAGLLSSIGESATCMQDSVKKIPYTIDAINYVYDITKPQPQLFVTEDFKNLIGVLEQYAETMAFKTGGAEGLIKAIECQNVATIVYSSGLQVTGIFTEAKIEDGVLSFIKTTGPSALAVANKQIPGHGKDYHKDGFSSPVGKIIGSEIPVEDLDFEELKSLSIRKDYRADFTFESGLHVNGLVKEIKNNGNKIILIVFEDCTVHDKENNILFKPEWGTYDMAVGEKIVSVFNGAADKDAFEELTYISNKQTQPIHYDEHTTELHRLYSKVREIREKNAGFDKLAAVAKTLKEEQAGDWLCALEILEILHQHKVEPALEIELRSYLEQKALNEVEHSKLLKDGLRLIEITVTQLNYN
jgi:phenylalanine-4-hydroxylase